MSNEITLNLELSMVKSSLSLSRKVTRLLADLSGSTQSLVVQTIGTTSEALAIGSDVTAEGYAWFRNCDATNFIEIGVEDGSSTFIAFAKLLPGEVCITRLATLSIYAKADTAAANLEHWVMSA